MSFISVRGRGPDDRLDKVIDKLVKVETNANVLSDIDVMQQEELDLIQRELIVLEDSIDFTNNRVTDTARRIIPIEKDLEKLLSAPTPIIPDIRPLNREIGRLRDEQDEHLVSAYKETALVWDALKELKRDLTALKNTPPPRIPSLVPVYALIAVSMILGLATLILAT